MSNGFILSFTSPGRQSGGVPTIGTPDYLQMLESLYSLAYDAGAFNTTPRFFNLEPRIQVPGVKEDWIISRTEDRYVDCILDVPDTDSPGSTSLAMFGAYGSANGLGILRAGGAGWAWYSTDWVSSVSVGTVAGWRGKRVYFGAFYDYSAASFTLYVRIGAGEQTTYTLALANGGTPMVDYVSPGGNISNIASVPGMACLWMANYSSDPGDSYRDAIQAIVNS